METGNINKAYTMTATERKKLQRDFLRRVGPNAETFKALFDTLPDATFYMMDDQDRIMAYNRRNCVNSNIRSEAEIVGKKSSEVFPAVLAEVYMARDREVRRTGKPILNRVYGHGADRSTDLRIVNIYPLRDVRGKIIGTVCLYRTVASGDSKSDWYGAIKKAVAHIDAHFAEPLALSALAAVSGMSVTSFRRTFKQVMEITPGSYIATIRINHARKLLATTDMKIFDIAEACGFYDQSHFIRTFKRIRRQTPAQYRRTHFSA